MGHCSLTIAKKLSADGNIPIGTVIKEVKNVELYPEDVDEDKGTTAALVLDEFKEVITHTMLAMNKLKMVRKRYTIVAKITVLE